MYMKILHFQMYIGLVGPRSTEMTKSANAILQSYYMLQRKSLNRDPSRTTVRMLDSLVRFVIVFNTPSQNIAFLFVFFL